MSDEVVVPASTPTEPVVDATAGRTGSLHLGQLVASWGSVGAEKPVADAPVVEVWQVTR